MYYLLLCNTMQVKLRQVNSSSKSSRLCSINLFVTVQYFFLPEMPYKTPKKGNTRYVITYTCLCGLKCI